MTITKMQGTLWLKCEWDTHGITCKYIFQWGTRRLQEQRKRVAINQKGKIIGR